MSIQRKSRSLEMSTELYASLNKKEPQMRLLQILPSHSENTRCLDLRLRTVSMKPAKCMRYVAVSYTWGDESPTKTIKINDQPTQIRKNIWKCFQHLRRYPHLHRKEYLWVDTVCIDQANTEEKSQQVGLMGQIFANASQVLVWLSSISCCDITRFNIQAFRSVPSSSLEPETLKVFVTAFKDRYWTRLWIVQEIMLARYAYVIFGQQKFTLTTINYIMKKNHLTSKDDNLGHTMRGTWYGALPSLVESARRDPPELYLLLRDHHYRGCAVPRDRVYGLLGLAAGSHIPVDYTCSDQVVLLRTIERTLMTPSPRSRRNQNSFDLIVILCKSLGLRPRKFLMWLFDCERLVDHRQLVRCLLDFRATMDLKACHVTKPPMVAKLPSENLVSEEHKNQQEHFFKFSFAGRLDVLISCDNKNVLRFHNAYNQQQGHENDCLREVLLPLSQRMQDKILTSARHSNVPWKEYVDYPEGIHLDDGLKFQLKCSLLELIYLADIVSQAPRKFWLQYGMLPRQPDPVLGLAQ